MNSPQAIGLKQKVRIFFLTSEKRNKKDFFDAGSEDALAGLPLAKHYKSLFASFSSEKEESYFYPIAVDGGANRLDTIPPGI